MGQLVYTFLPGATINRKKYFELFKDKLKIHMDIHQGRIFMHDGVMAQSRIASDFLKNQKVEVCNGMETVPT